MPTDPEERSLQRVAYLGPPGTFSEQALLEAVRRDNVEPVAMPSIYDAVMAVQNGDSRFAVVPIENSVEGSVTVTLDTLVFDAQDVRIVGEQIIAVQHALIAASELGLGRITKVFSHPHVPGQCARLLHGELAHAEVCACGSTAEAVQTVAERPEQPWAAIGTSLAAELYGAVVLRHNVEDRSDNETRFVWLALEGQVDYCPLTRPAGDQWKTSLVFWGAGARRAGWLVRCLDEFAGRSINLTRIESRPQRERLGSYMFYLDLQGALQDPVVRNAIEGLRSLCEEVRILGSYPQA